MRRIIRPLRLTNKHHQAAFLTQSPSSLGSLLLNMHVHRWQRFRCATFTWPSFLTVKPCSCQGSLFILGIWLFIMDWLCRSSYLLYLETELKLSSAALGWLSSVAPMLTVVAAPLVTPVCGYFSQNSSQLQAICCLLESRLIFCARISYHSSQLYFSFLSGFAALRIQRFYGNCVCHSTRSSDCNRPSELHINVAVLWRRYQRRHSHRLRSKCAVIFKNCCACRGWTPDGLLSQTAFMVVNCLADSDRLNLSKPVQFCEKGFGAI